MTFHPNGSVRLALVAWLLAAATTLTATATAAQQAADEEAPAPVTREYLHQQPPHTPLVFRFETFEAEFESRLAEDDAGPFKVSGVPGLRIGPVFQFVEAAPKSRQLTIEAALGRRSARARIDMAVIRFDPAGPDQELLQQAYRLLSHGLEAAPAGRTDLWQQKVISLKQAVTLFDRLGMQDPTLWAGFYAAHFMLERLGDALTAAEDARRLQELAARSRQSAVLLAAFQLEGRALLALAAARGDDAVYDRARQVFARAAQHAAEMDYQHERALALFFTGLADERQGRHDRAFARWDEALDVTALAGDVDLANAIRRHAAALHERLGQTDAAIAMMQRIETRRPAAVEPATSAGPAVPSAGPTQRDNVRYLYEQGRLLEKAGRHDEAIAVLTEALALASAASGDATAGPVGILLGIALFEAGRFDDADTRLVDAIPRTAAAGHASELLRAWDVLATIRRDRGEHDAAAASREQQAKFVTTTEDRAQLEYQFGLDAVARGDAAPARQAFREAARAADRAGLAALGRLARLQICALDGGRCEALGELPAVADDAVDALEARWIAVQVLRGQGRAAEAAAAAERLLGEVLRARRVSPGKLGAWYWLRRDALFDAYLGLRLDRDGAGGDTASATLAALGAVRGSDSGAATTGADVIDTLAADLRGKLARLSPDTTLLSWYVAADRAHAWVGRRGDLRIVPLRWNANRSREVAALVEAIRAGAAAGTGIEAQLGRLGALLLDPVADALAPVVLFLPLGPLQGLPLDALPISGQPLLRRHRVVHLASLDGLDATAPAPNLAAPLPVFVAGNRQQGAGDFSIPTPPSAELGAVTERFVGPGLTLLRGAALQWDEFQDERFREARLLHLAMPAVEDLADPAGSRLLMSDNADDPERLDLYAPELRGPLRAELAVLSQAEFSGSPGSPLAPADGLVGTLLERGAGAVVASLWPVGDAAAAEFMARFYAALASSTDLGEALATTKRTYLSEAADTRSWAAFQLFVE